MLPSLTVLPLPLTAVNDTTCVMILQYLTSVSGGNHGQTIHGSSMCERAMQGKVGTGVRTPAMQARLVAKRLTFRDVFTAVGRSHYAPHVQFAFNCVHVLETITFREEYCVMR